MHRLWGKVSALENGQGLVEYGLILVLTSVVVILGLTVFGQGIREEYCKIVQAIKPDADTSAVCPASQDAGNDDSDNNDDNDDDEGTIDVACHVISSNPFKMNASVSDNAGPSNIAKVEFYVDGHLHNTEYSYMYCLQNGDSSCQTYSGSSGTHQFRAVAYDEDGHTGSCTTTATVP